MQPQRLPIVDSDDGVWGDIIRQYLMKEHFNDDTDNAANGGHQKVTIRAGTTTDAPLKLTSGSLLTSPQAGAIEFLGDSFYATQTTGTTRKKLAIYDDSAGATGDIYFRNSGGYFSRLGIGSSGDYLAVSSGVPTWTSQIVGKSLDNTNTITVKDANFTLQHTSDVTKQARFQLSGITAGTVRAYTLPDATSVLLNDVSNQNISGVKTFQAMMYAREIWITPTNGAGNTAAFSLDNQSGQVWQNTNNAGGSWALWDQTNSKAPILVQPNSPDQAIVVDPSGVYVDDSYFKVANLADPTKQAKFELSGITTNTIRTYTLPNANTTIVGTDITQTLANKTLTTPVINGASTGTGVSTTATANTLVMRDANGSTAVGNLLDGYSTTATSGGTTTLTVASNRQQFFTGTSAQTLVLPVTSTLALGFNYVVTNNSTGALTVQSSGANTILIMPAGTSALFTCILTSGTTAASWSYAYTGTVVASGKKLTVSQSLTVAGTDGTTMTFPTTSATIARTDAAQTFTGVQTFSSAPAFGALPTGAGVATAATASTLAARDANKNLTANAYIPGFTTTATTGGTTTLTIASTQLQVFTGSSTQTLTLPTTSVAQGVQYTIVNQSSGTVTVQSSGANTVATLGGGSSAQFTAAVATPTTSAHWIAQTFGSAVILPRVTTITSSATPTFSTDATDMLVITALATAVTSMTSGMTGTAVNGQRLMVRIKDNGTPQSITWGANFISSGIAALPTTTVAAKTHHIGFIYDSVAAKWVCMAVDAAGY